MKSTEQLQAEQRQLAMRGYVVSALRAPNLVPAAANADESVGRAVLAKSAQKPGQALLLRPDTIVPSRYANRLDFNWTGRPFQKLKKEIAAEGRNIVPIKVRSAPTGEVGEYQIVYGHRRHRACLELGLPVLVVVEELNDQELLVQMVKENDSRTDCSPYERGVHFRKAMREGLFPSQLKLAEATGCDSSMVGKLLKLADLPDEVLAAFPALDKIQVRWGQELEEALAKDKQGVLNRARVIVASGQPTEAKEVMKALVAAPVMPASEPDRVIRIERDGKPWAAITVPLAAKGEGIRVEFCNGAGVLVDDLRAVLQHLK